jgi:hypothetical protein
MADDISWSALVSRGQRLVAELTASREAIGRVVLQVESEYGHEGVMRMAWLFASGESDLSRMRKRGWKGRVDRSALGEELTYLEDCKRVALKGLLHDGPT